MNEPQTTKNSEFIFRRTVDSFDQFAWDMGVTGLTASWILGILAVVVLARIIYRYANPAGRAAGARDGTVWGLVWGVMLSLLGFAVLHESFVAVAGFGASSPYPDWRPYAAVAAVGVCGTALFAALIFGALGAYKFVSTYQNTRSRAPGAGDPISLGLAWLSGLLTGLLVVWVLVVFYGIEAAQRTETATETISTVGSANAIKWYSFTIGVFLLGAFFVAWMYIKDTRSVRWYWAVPLALLRMTTYAVLCLVFLLPAMQTREDTNKQSRVVILLDISNSVTSDKATDDLVTRPGQKPNRRIDYVIEFLTDENVAFLKRLMEKNPVAVYAFGSRLDESPQIIGQEDKPWGREEWEAFAAYDFRPFVLRDLSGEGRQQVQNSEAWQPSRKGDADWAASWYAQRNSPAEELKKFSGLTDDKDVESLKANLERLDNRIDVARTIMQGTNVADSVTAAVNREAANMVQGIIVISDGRSNLGSEASFIELRDRATREKIPVFTIAVGEDRQPSAITVSDVLAPDSAPIDEAWEINVEADGVGLAGKEVEVELHLFKPGSDFNAEDERTGYPLNSDAVLKQPLTFAQGDPPHGQAKFVIDPSKKEFEKLTTDSKDAAIKKRVLVEGKWAVKAVIAKHEEEAFPKMYHVRARPGINVVQQKLRVLLITGAPSREFTFLRTLLVREVQDQRATLTTFIQNEAGTGGNITPELGETLLRRFPSRLDLTNTDLGAEEKPYNLNEYDVIVAFDPDWTELSQQQADDLARWVREGGGGLIFVAGPINTFQLARVEENTGKLFKLLEVLPVVPADIVAQRLKPLAKTERRLKLYPERIVGSELLKLDEKAVNDPVAGWEPFFTGREKYAPSPDLKVELFPKRGFYSAYPVERVKAGSAVLAELMDVSDTGDPAPAPWIVTNNPQAPYRTAFLANGELYRLRIFEPGEGTGREYFERFWMKMIKYMAAKRNFKAPRGRVLVSKEAVSGVPLRVQARILDEGAKPYDRDIDPKFKIVQEKVGGEKREYGPFKLQERRGAGGDFEGYYAGQELLDPARFPPDDSTYRVVIDVPDAPGETLSGEFRIRQSDPETDNRRPDFAALLRVASEFGKDFREARLSGKTEIELGRVLPKEANVQRLAFRLNERESLKLIPDCMITLKTQNQNRGPINDLWDLGFTMPTAESQNPTVQKYFVSWWSGQRLSVVLLLVVFLLSLEWLVRKLLRLA